MPVSVLPILRSVFSRDELLELMLKAVIAWTPCRLADVLAADYAQNSRGRQRLQFVSPELGLWLTLRMHRSLRGAALMHETDM